MGILPTGKCVPSNYTISNQGNDHRVDPLAQQTYCEPSLAGAPFITWPPYAPILTGHDDPNVSISPLWAPKY